MTIATMMSENGKELSITVDGKFDFSLHQSFKEAYSSFSEQNMIIILDLSKTSYLDSSALGMILLLKDHAEKNANKIMIKNPNEAVSKILKIAQFHRLLTIDG
jgi:anti-anti-sigma factor